MRATERLLTLAWNAVGIAVLGVAAISARSVHGGEDPFLVPLVLIGGVGAIAASALACTEQFVAMIDLGLAGDIRTAGTHSEAFLLVIASVFAETSRFRTSS